MNNNIPKLATLTAGIALALSGTALAQTTLKVSHYLPPVHGIHTDFIVPWTEQITACTNGEVQFDIYPGGTQLGNVAKQQEQVVAGVVDIAHGLHGIPRGRFPRTSLIELPFMTRDAGRPARPCGICTQRIWPLNIAASRCSPCMLTMEGSSIRRTRKSRRWRTCRGCACVRQALRYRPC
ncbi:type 2 periplasmic-binding domain-containing protein [Modicisalibacter luteus]|uniref:hypothetical protein n=1 Tax=Modicisalibacter luteus TaxID=453962 RepID=UPI00363BF7A8